VGGVEKFCAAWTPGGRGGCEACLRDCPERGGEGGGGGVVALRQPQVDAGCVEAK